jgi:hypothetical protein
VTTTDSPAPPTGTASETLRVKGEVLAERVGALLHQGNVRRVVVKDKAGNTVIEVPVTAAAALAVLAPVVTGVAAFAALAADWHVDVHRHAAPSLAEQ